MAVASFRRLKAGARIGEITVGHPIAETRGRHPVYAVWNHQSWCAMACKVFRNLEQAEQEYAVLADLQHPGIVRPLGVRRPALMLMEHLGGPTLEGHVTWRPEGRMSIGDALRTAIHLGGAVQHVHSRGYLHLDLKPGNAAYVDDRPILFDFGTARRIDGPQPDHVVGTNPYISPEVCRGERATPASDVFGLGVTLYELLTGALPYEEETARNPYPQLTAPPTPLRRHRRHAPAGLELLVMSCLAPDPGARPSLPELMRSLHGFIRTGPRMWPAAVDAETPDQPCGSKARSLAA